MTAGALRAIEACVGPVHQADAWASSQAIAGLDVHRDDGLRLTLRLPVPVGGYVADLCRRRCRQR